VASIHPFTEPPSRSVRLPLRRPRGLLVENEYLQLLSRRDLLRLLNLDVVYAMSSAEALDQLRNLQFRVDVVVTDLNLVEGSGEMEGVDVAAAVSDNSGGGIPVYAYSGKRDRLERESRHLFRAVVLKSEPLSKVKDVFEEATQEAVRHFGNAVDRAARILSGVTVVPRRLDPPDVTLIRDLVAGAAPSALPPRAGIPEAVGFLLLDREAGVGVPYGIEPGSEILGGEGFYASVVGHDYLYGYGLDRNAAVSHLEDVLRGFLDTVDLTQPAVGHSRRLRKLLAALTRGEEQGSTW